MNTYHISVKAEPDWNIESHKSDLMLENEERNSTSPESGRNIKKELQGNSSNVEMEETTAESSSSEPGKPGLPGEALRVSTPGFHRSWSTRSRTSNFSKKDCQIFRQIIDKYGDIVFNTKTDNATNLKKKAAWENIVTEFNASTAEKRTFKQLQAKFDNMKRSQRRMSKKTKVVITVPLQEINSDISPSATPLVPATNELLSLDGLANNEALNNMKTKLIKLRGSNGENTRSAIPLAPAINEPLSLDDPANNEAFNMMEVQFAEGVDSLETTAEEPHSTAVVTDPIPVEFSEVPLIPSVPPSLPRIRVCQTVRHATAIQPRFRKRTRPAEIEHERYLKWRQNKLEALHCAREYDRILFETKLQHLEEKRREEKEIYELKKRKLELEVRLLEKQNRI